MTKTKRKRNLMALLLACTILFTAAFSMEPVLAADDEPANAETGLSAYRGAKVVEVYGTAHDPSVFQVYTEPNGACWTYAVLTSGYDANGGYYDNVNVAEALDMRVSDVYEDETGVLWFYFEVIKEIRDTADGEPYLFELKEWLKADTVRLDRVVNTAGGTTVVASGNVPEGVSLSAKMVEPDGAKYGIDAGHMLAALDIKLSDAEGAVWQPGENGETVTLMLDAAAWGVKDGSVVNIHHDHGGEVTVMSRYVVLGGKLTFAVSDFSIFIVETVGDASGTTQIEEESTYTMTAGAAPEIFYWAYDDDNDTNFTNYSSIACVWYVSDPAGAISFTVHESQPDTFVNYMRYAPYIQVTPLKTGTVTLTMEYVELADGRWQDTHTVKTVSFTIQVVAHTDFYIADSVAESGCLVPAWPANTQPEGDVTYKWQRSDGQLIRSEALNDDGSVNISKDRGGVTNARGPITYTVTAIDENGNEYTAAYTVFYGNEILNPGFETPVVVPYFKGAGAHNAFYNGFPGLYWKTTAPGTGTEHLTQDIEIVRPGLSQEGEQVFHGVEQAAHGEQYAEVNAEEYGALYQDVLTTPGATFDWNFSHAARPNGQNTVYIVLAGTEYAQALQTATEIDPFLAGIENATIPASGEGYTYTYQGDTYMVWKHDADTNRQTWEEIAGAYTIPPEQYLTRLFFISENSGDRTQGNLIDNVVAGQVMYYKIEYYVEGVLQSGSTETGAGSVYDLIPLDNLDSFDGLVVTGVTVNGRPYPGEIDKGLYITDHSGESGDPRYQIVLQVYLKATAITVTKEVVFDDSLSPEELDALLHNNGSGYTARFALRAGETVVDTAEATIHRASADGTVTAICDFDTTLEMGTEYTVAELSSTPIDGYVLDSTAYRYEGTTLAEPVTVVLSADTPTASIVCENRYAVSASTLTITKKLDAAPASGESFVFHVTGDGLDMQAVIGIKAGTTEGSVTITGLTVGERVIVTELGFNQDYEPDGEASAAVTLQAAGNDVVFSNKKADGPWLTESAHIPNLFKEP